MLSKSDKKLSQQVKVLLERLPETHTPPRSINVETKQLYKCPNYETLKKSSKEYIKIEESNMPSSVKKEKKDFEVVDCKVERLSKAEHIYSRYMKSEKVTVDAYTNPSLNIDLNPIVTSKPKDWYSKETKIEKETKESLKGIIGSNLSNRINLRKRPHPDTKDSDKKIYIQSKIKPLIELVPLVVKTEESEIRTVKKIQRKVHNVVDLDKESAENSFTVTPSSQELVSQYADVSIVIHRDVFKICKSIPHSSIKSFNSKRDSFVEAASENKGAVGFSHETLGEPANDLAEERSSNRGNTELTHQTVKKPEDGHVKEDSLNGCTAKSSHQNLERTEVSLSENVPKIEDTFESNSKILGRLGEGFEDSISGSPKAFIHQISKQQDQNLGRLVNCPREEGTSNESIAEFSHQTLDNPEEKLVKEDSLERCTVESNSKTLVRSREGFEDEASTNCSAEEYIHQNLKRTAICILDDVQTKKCTFESFSKTLGRAGKDFEAEVSTNDSVHHISKQQGEDSEPLPQDHTLGRLNNDPAEGNTSSETIAEFSERIAEFSHQTLEKPKERLVKENSLERCTVENSSKVLLRSREAFENDASTNGSAVEYINQSLSRTEFCLLDEVQKNTCAPENIPKTLGKPSKDFEVEDSTNDSALDFIQQISKQQGEGSESLPLDQTLGSQDNHIAEERPSSESIAELSHHAVEADDSNSKTLVRSRECFEDEASTNENHHTLERQGNGSETLLQDQTLGKPSLEEGPSNGGIVEFNHQTLEKPKNDLIKEDALNRCTIESTDKTLGRTEVVLFEEVPTNRNISNLKTLERIGKGLEDEASKNGPTVKYIHQIPERIRFDFENESSSINGSTTESHSDQTVESPAVSPVEVSQTLHVQHEPVTTFLNTDSTITRKGFIAEKLIKVKAPQDLGIQSQHIPRNPQNICLENRLNISHLSQIRSASGNESKIAEICKVYPIFFTPEARSDISVLIQILHKVSKGLTLDQIKSKQCDETYFLNIQNCGKMFVKTFNRILKLDQIGLDKDLLKKIIPILYLHIDKGFKRLRPEDDFDFRIIMKTMFEAESFVCDHDVILEKNYEMFQKVMMTFDRWLEDIFIECDVSDSLKLLVVINNAEDGSPSSSGQFSPDPLEDATMELGSDNLATSEQQIDSTANTRSQDVSMCDADVELNYLQCPICRESLPMCCICKELLSCPCLSELQSAFDRGPRSLTFCREHAKCGDTWPRWLEDWIEVREDHDMPLNPICWSAPCNNKAELLCVCRIQAYCSLACQVEDWYAEHHRSCRRESDPNCYMVPREEDMDAS